MENQLSVVPDHHPYNDFPLTDQTLMSDGNPSLGFPEITSVGEPSSFSALFSESEVGFCDDFGKIWDPDGVLSDSYIWDMIKDPTFDVVGNPQVDASGNNGESVNEGNVVNSIPQGLGTDQNQMQPPLSEVAQCFYNCSCCHVLREIIHVNGKHVRNLGLHGQIGLITHAVLDKYDLDSSSKSNVQQKFEFWNESLSSVRAFLEQYLEKCTKEGFIMLQDPLSSFYRTLCIGYDGNADVSCDDFPHTPPQVSGDLQASQQDANSDEIRPSRAKEEMMESQPEADRKEATTSSCKSFLATQRERTGRLKLKDFSGYFDLPIHEAAKRMNVCPTVIKKKCRQGGLSRWPYRKIKGIKRKILKKQQDLKAAASAEERVCIAEDIRMLEQEIQNIFAKYTA